mmetsp:Transcript_9119/g.15377  ORF Transcript_9119/g.15377 Transcript_9119/m.15377 type:complete len:97 (+) Transcript_9119:1150-1440(+)
MIACDLGKFVKEKYDKEAVGTFTGFVNGFGSFGKVLGQVIFPLLKDMGGWRGVFLGLALFVLLSSVPALPYLIFEFKKWRVARANAQVKKGLEYIE